MLYAKYEFIPFFAFHSFNAYVILSRDMISYILYEIVYNTFYDYWHSCGNKFYMLGGDKPQVLIFLKALFAQSNHCVYYRLLQ